MTSLEIKDSIVNQAKKIIQESSQTFYFASRFLGKKKRQAIWLLYAFCRLTDNLVDSNQSSLEEKTKNLNNWQADFQKDLPTDPILQAFKREVIEEFSIPFEYPESIIEGCRRDLEKKDFSDFPELEFYAYQVASCVGIISLYVLGFDRKKEKEVLERAIEAGIALQLTNIIRDVLEDLKLYQRVYLPEKDFARFSYSKEELKKEVFNQNFEKLILLQIYRAKELYAKSHAGLKSINWKNRLAITAALRIYEEILNKILNRGPLSIVKERIFVSKLEKILLIPEIIYLSFFSKYPSS